MAKSIVAGLWKMILFIANFLVKVVAFAAVKALSQGIGLAILGVVVFLAVGALIVRARRRR